MPATVSVVFGGAGQLTAAVRPADAQKQAAAWSSSDETIATVDAIAIPRANGLSLTNVDREGKSVIYQLPMKR